MGKLVSYKLYTEGKEEVSLAEAYDMVDAEAGDLGRASITDIIEKHDILERQMGEKERIIELARVANKNGANILGIAQLAALAGLTSVGEVRRRSDDHATISLGNEGMGLVKMRGRILPVKFLSPTDVDVRLSTP